MKKLTTPLITAIAIIVLIACVKSQMPERNFAIRASVAAKRVSPINLSGVSNLVINGDTINGGKVPCITLKNCTGITIENCYLYGSTTVGIQLLSCSNVRIAGNFIKQVASGVYAIGCSKTVVTNNQMLNMLGPFPRGQFVQFDTETGAGNAVTNNRFENILGQSYPEDAISMYKSNGTAASPIIISGNWIRGGGPSKTGGGINLGDNGGSYLTASNNILVNPGQYGIQISGGSFNSLNNNTVYGAKQSFTNVGVSVWGQAGYAISNATAMGNLVNFVNSAGQQNSDWLGSGSTGSNTPAGWATNVFNDTKIAATVLPSVIITHK